VAINNTATQNQCVKSWPHSRIPDYLPRIHVGPISIILQDRFLNFAQVPDPYRQRSDSFANVTSITFAGNAVHVVCCELGITHLSGPHECVLKVLLGFENLPDVLAIPFLQ